MPRGGKRGVAKEHGERKTKKPCTTKELGEGELVAGIDLGTTNSCIAVTRGDQVQVVPMAGGRQTIPSVVAFLPNREYLVGEKAKRQARADPQNTFFSVKRFIGCEWKEVRKESEQVPYRVEADEEGQAVISCSHTEDGFLYPEEVSGRVLAQLISAAEGFAGQGIRKAVVSVPAYFTDAQREATVTAGQIAGLETVKLIKEPVAAALAYQVDVSEDQTVMVLDLGGGTFDVSILEVGGGVVEVISTGGDAHLGGDDWDKAIISWLASNYLSATGVSWRAPEILGNLKAVAELAKVKLSTEKQVALKIPLKDRNGQPITSRLTQQELDRISQPLYKRLRLPVDACCWQAGVDLEAALKEDAANRRKPAAKRRAGGVLIAPKDRPPVSKVLLVGGATRMPTFQRFVANMTGIKPDPLLVDPDLLETMDPLRRALMEALAKKQLLENEQLAREKLGDDYEAFVRQRRKEDKEWEKIELELESSRQVDS